MKKKYLYMQVTRDKYELPIHVAESVTELARMVHKTPNTISSMISKKIRGWIKVEVEE